MTSSDKIKLDSIPAGVGGVIPLSGGGTGATTPAGARNNLGLKDHVTHPYGTTANSVAEGNDSRIVNSVQTSGNQTISGVKTFSSFPVTPSAAPTASYQVANKKYVDDSVAVPVDQIFTFESALPPDGYIARNGQAIDSARMPKLYARYGANMPDDRNRVYRMQGGLTGAVGSAQEDAMQVIKGSFHQSPYTASTSGSDLFLASRSDGTDIISEHGPGSVSRFDFDTSRVARTAVETRVKSRIVIFCNKIQ